MKRFLSGFLCGALIAGSIGVFAVTSYVANPVDFKVMVNGEEFVSDPPALEINGRTYLPLRAMGDALGVPVNWNEELRQAEVGTTTPKVEQNQYSRNNPAPINTVQTYTQDEEYSLYDNHSINLRVMEVIRGQQAWDKIIAANQFNDEPDEGYEYALVKIGVSVMTVENDGAYNLSEYEFKSFSSNNEEMPGTYVVTPDPQFEGKLYAGGNAEGWIVVQVKKDDKNPKLAYGVDYNGAGGVWFSLSK